MLDLSYRMASACKIECQNVSSAYNVYTNKGLSGPQRFAT